MTKLGILFVVTAALIGCGKTEPSAEKSAAKAPTVTVDAAAVNALVPAELKTKFGLEFEQREIDLDRGRKSEKYVVAGPKGWEVDKMFGKMKPPKSGGADAGFFTAMSVGSNCDGSCSPKDWAATSDKVEFKQFEGKTIKKDDKTDTGRKMIVEDGDKTHLVRAWWTKDASRYFVCRASLDGEIRGAIAAFEAACAAVQTPE